MSETCGEYVTRMLQGRFVHPAHIDWLAGNDRHRGLAVTIFMAIKDLSVYKKLANDPDWAMVNGQEIREAVTRETHSYASYWLQRPEVRDAFKQLTDAGLLIKKMRNSAPYGYGDDELYWITAMGGVLIKEGKTNDLIKLGLNNILRDEQTISGASKGRFCDVDVDDLLNPL